MELSLCPFSEIAWCDRVRAREDTNFGQEDTEIRSNRDDTGVVVSMGEFGNIDKGIDNGRLFWEGLW